MTDDHRRSGDWDRHQWAGEGPAPRSPRQPGADPLDHPTAERPGDIVRRGEVPEAGGPGSADRWTKTQWVGDLGNGAPEPIDPVAMPEGENRLSGDRHNPGEEHWAQGQAREPRDAAEGRPRDAAEGRPRDRA
jgi:hypothetical protein